ncbi:MAG: toll/interleukin-1 receptor domain-containing protein, partial [Bryobacteraceae bacterium]
MGKPIFISYRTRDAAGHADHLFYALSECFPQQIFFDVETLQPGALWSQEIEDNVRECQVLLVVIGQDWLMCQDSKSGQRCLDRRVDWVRGEIEIALGRVPQPLIIPLLVADAGMPEADYLPETIQALPCLQYKAI